MGRTISSSLLLVAYSLLLLGGVGSLSLRGRSHPPKETGFIPPSFFFLVPIKNAPTAAASQPRSASRPQTWAAGARAGVVGRRSARRRRVERLGRRAPTRPIPCYPAAPWPRTILFCGARAVVSFGRGRRAADGGRPPFPGSNQSSQAACSKGGASPCDRHGRLTPTIRARAQPERVQTVRV